MSLVDSVIVSCKNIGIYFCDTIPSSYIDPTPPYTFHWNLTHQPELQFYKDLSNKVGWTTLDTTYTASGYEKYLIIGNFLSNSQSDSTNVGGNAPITGNYGWQGAIYYFDDVRITLLDGTGINSPTNLPKGEAYKVLPNPNNGSFTIQTNEFDKQVQFVLTNTMGQVVDNIPVKSSSTMYKNNNLTNGIYFYTTVCNGAVTSRGKFMVQK
jgi:hypothetical protein